MVGYRRTHNYPHGKPFPLVLVDIIMAALAGAWVFLSPGHWPRAIGIIAVFLVIVFIRMKLTGHCERTGHAVRIPRPQIVVKFPRGLPVSMRATRLTFFVIVAIMFVFGFAPVADATAKAGIVACIVALFGVAILNVALERHSVKIGHAKEIDVSSSPEA